MPFQRGHVVPGRLPIQRFVETVGDDLGAGEDKFAEMLLGSDGRLYGVPFAALSFLCYDPKNGTSALVGERQFCCL